MQKRGFTLIELLVAALIFSTVLTLTSRYFNESRLLQRTAQARSELQDRVRTTMAVVTQDLQNAGSSRYVAVSGSTVTINKSVSGWVACSTSSPCLSGANGGSLGEKDTFSVRYVTSIPSQNVSCRSVAYSFSSDGDGNILMRQDNAGCLTANIPAAVVFSPNILAMNIVYNCSDGTTENNPASCRVLNTNPHNRTTVAYARSATVTIMGQSAETTQTPRSSNSEGYLVTCPTGRECYQMRQEVLMPSLKDN